MKLPFRAALLFAGLIWVIPAGIAQTEKNPLQGVWKYEVDDMEGMAIMSSTHFIWILTPKNRACFGSPSQSEKAQAIESLIAQSGTWELESSNRARATHVYSTIPGDSGKSVRWDFKIEGDLLTSWILGPDGQRVNQVKCRKLGEWNATGETSFHNGVWEYLSLKGIYLHSGSYGGWFILNKPIETSGTVQSRASNFDAVNVAIVVGTRRQDDRYIWNVVHAVDQRMEGESYITTGNSMQLPKSALWFVDNNGKTVGEAIRTIRIAQ